MRKQFITLAAFVSIVLVGCQESEGELEVKEEYPVSIEASIVNTGGSRYVGDEPNNAVFESGDYIGLAYKVGTETTNFVQWILNESVWNPVGTSMKWKSKTDNHTFYAFYPYNYNDATPTLEKVKMPILTGQDGSMSCVALRDFLVATKTQTYLDGDKVSFTGDNAFKHVSSLVALKLKYSGDLLSATINCISLEGTDLVTESNYSFVDNSSTEANETGKVSFENGVGHDVMVANWDDGIDLDKDKTFYFVVNSGTVDLDNVTLRITYSLEGEGVYTATKVGLKKTDGGHTRFQKGCMYNYGITVTTDKVLTISNHDISDWGDGDTFDITIESERKEVSE